MHVVADSPDDDLDRPTFSDALDATLAREHVGRLIETYREGIAVLQKAMFAQATSMALEVLAQRTVEHASASGAEDAIDRAISTTAAASRAVDHEDRCADAWASHLAAAKVAIAEAEEMFRGRHEVLGAPDMLSAIRAERARSL